eukprot:jgi/Pico_ML_1/51650/g227.t1
MVARAAVSWARRGMSSVGASPYDTGFLEVRQYTLVPEKMKEYMQLAGATAELRKRLNPGFLSFFTCDTGSVLNRVTHFYHYKDLDERERVRKTMAENPEWQEFIDKSRPGLQMQESMLFLQAVECHKAAGSCNVNEFESSSGTGSSSSLPTSVWCCHRESRWAAVSPTLHSVADCSACATNGRRASRSV